MEAFYRLSGAWRTVVKNVASLYAASAVSRYQGVVDESPSGFACPLAMNLIRQQDPDFGNKIRNLITDLETVLELWEQYEN